MQRNIRSNFLLKCMLHYLILCVWQSYSNDGDFVVQREMLRSSPNRPHRHSVGFVPTAFNGTLPPSELQPP